VYTAPNDGVIASIEPRAIGRGVTALGGGRTTMEDAIDPSVGFVITAKPGERVTRGEPLATVYARDREGAEVGLAVLQRAISIADEGAPPLPLVGYRVTARGVETA
jgi:thymidine phosphorylase